MAYRGARRDGSGRLVLELESPGRFRLRALDPLRRAMWTLDFVDGTVTLLDHRNKVHCVGLPSIDFPELDLRAVSASSVPAVLLGYFPVSVDSMADEADGSVRLRDGDGRTWIAKLAADRLVGWSLLREDQVWLRWTATDNGGILSHRSGDEYSWSELVRESLDAGLAELNVPPKYARGSCSAPDDLSELR